MKVRITETRVYEYKLDLESDFFVDRDITTYEEAMMADKKWIEIGNDIEGLMEMDGQEVLISREWELLNE